MLPIHSSQTNITLIDNKSLATWEPQALLHEETRVMNSFFLENGIKKVVNLNKRLQINYQKILEMNPIYKGERIKYAGYLDRIEDYQIFAYAGKLYDRSGHLINTKKLDFDTGAILIMDLKGNLFLSHKKRGEIHHSTFLAGAPVAYACMLEVKEGIIIEEEVWSGHYRPTQITQDQFHDRLRKDFTESYDQNLIAFFLTSVFIPTELHLPSDQRCLLSNAPLFDAVKLPCGHIFNNGALKEWHAKRPSCPLDNKPFSLSTIVSQTNLSATLIERYDAVFSIIKVCNIEADNKIRSFQLDDWSSRDFPISGLKDRVGVILFLKPETTLRKIAQIAQTLRLSPNPHEFIIAGSTRNDLETPLKSLPFKAKHSHTLYVL